MIKSFRANHRVLAVEQVFLPSNTGSGSTRYGRNNARLLCSATDQPMIRREEFKRCLWVLGVALGVILMPSLVFSSWPTAGLFVAYGGDDDMSMRAIPDGLGGVIIVWDNADGCCTYSGVFAQRIDSTGNCLWGQPFITVSDVVRSQWNPHVGISEPGGAIVLWQDDRFWSSQLPLDVDIFAQKITASGDFAWTPNGELLQDSGGWGAWDPRVVSNGSGGALTVYEINRFIYARGISSTGEVSQNWNSLLQGIIPFLVSDGAGGGIVANKGGGASESAYATRIGADGTTLWSDSVFITVPQSGYVTDVISDGQGGAVFVWYEDSPERDIYAQRISSDGQLLWGIGGAPVCQATGDQITPVICRDGSGGFVIAWSDLRRGTTNLDVYVQRVDSLGGMVWNEDGVLVGVGYVGYQTSTLPSIASDESGTVIVVWTKNLEVWGGMAVCAQKLDLNGATLWSSGGISVVEGSGMGTYYRPNVPVVSDKAGGAIAVYLSGIDYKSLYAQRIYANGQVGDPLDVSSATFEDSLYSNGQIADVEVETRSHGISGDFMVSTYAKTNVGQVYHIGTENVTFNPEDVHVSSFQWTVPDDPGQRIVDIRVDVSEIVALDVDQLSQVAPMPSPQSPIISKMFDDATSLTDVPHENIEAAVQQASNCDAGEICADAWKKAIPFLGIAYSMQESADIQCRIDELVDAGRIRQAAVLHAVQASRGVRAGLSAFSTALTVIRGGVFSWGGVLPGVVIAGVTCAAALRDWGSGSQLLHDGTALTFSSSFASEFADSLAVAYDSIDVTYADHVIVEGSCDMRIEADSSYTSFDSTGLHGVVVVEFPAYRSRCASIFEHAQRFGSVGGNANSASIVSLTADATDTLSIILLHRDQSGEVTKRQYRPIPVTPGSSLNLRLASNLTSFPLRVDVDGDGGWDEYIFPMLPTARQAPEFVLEWGSFGSGPGQFYTPLGIAVDDSAYVYVTDIYNHRVQKFTSDGEFVTAWGHSGQGEGEFDMPRGIVVDRSGYVYVSDHQESADDRIQKFTHDGVFLGMASGDGTGDGEFLWPTGLAIDGLGNVYVADSQNHRIQELTNDLDFVLAWGAPGIGDGEFAWPTYPAIGPHGLVYVSDRSNNRIQQFRTDGTYVNKWGQYGFAEGEFIVPEGIAVDPAGYVYVADNQNHRIQKFTSGGAFLVTWGSIGSEPGQFNSPFGIACNDSGDVYVVDTNNARIQKFSYGTLSLPTGVRGPVVPGRETSSLYAYPNPFNPTTSIAYYLSVSGPVTLRIYDVNGGLVRALVNETRTMGEHRTTWDGRDAAGVPAASGVYFLRLEVGGQVTTRKLVVLK